MFLGLLICNWAIHKFELAGYKTAKSKETYLKIEITIKELEHMHAMLDKECCMSDALYGLAGGTRVILQRRSLLCLFSKVPTQ